MVCHGVPEYVIVKGRVCVEEAEVKATLSRGLGEFVQTAVFPATAYPQAAPCKEPTKVCCSIFLLVNIFLFEIS